MSDKKPENMNNNKFLSLAWHSFMNSTSDLMFIKDIDLVYVDASMAFANLVGLSSAEEVVGKTDLDLFSDQKLAERYRRNDRQLLSSGRPLLDFIEPLPPDENGNQRYSSTSKFLIRDDNGVPVGLYAIGRDVTRKYEAHLAYERELEYLLSPNDNVYASCLFDITAWKSLDARSYGGGSAGEKLGFQSVSEFKAYASSVVVDDEDVRMFFKTMSRESMYKIFDSGKRRISFEYLRKMPDGIRRWVHDDLRLLQNPDTGHIMALFSISDIDDVKRAQHNLICAAEKDSMTGLLNHDATIEHITHYLEMDGSGGTHALFMIDVDNFKKVNDTLGHQTGDDVITDIASAIRKTFRDTDIVGRIGGDEFMALMKNAGGIRIAAKKAAELIGALQYDLRTAAGPIELSGSVGVSLFQGDGKSFDSLYSEADAALYKAKSCGKKRYAFAYSKDTETEGFSPSDAELSTSVHLRTLLEDLEGAVLIYDVAPNGDISISYTSPSVFKVFRHDPKDIGSEGEGLFSIVLPGDLLGLQDAIRKAAADKTVLDYTYRVLSAEGKVEWRCVRGTSISCDVNVDRMLCIVTDITKMKETEERLEFAELRSRAALQQSPAMLWEVDLRTHDMKYVGHAAEELGYTGRVYADAPESVLAEGHIRQDYIVEFSRMFDDLYAGRDGGSYYVMSRDAAGEFVPVSARFQLLRDEMGIPYYAVGIREPRIISRELDLYRTLNNSGVFSMRVDDDFTLLYGNDRYYSITGYTRETMAERLQDKCRFQIHPDGMEATCDAIRSAVLSGRRNVTLTIKILAGDSRVKYIQISGEFAIQPDGSSVMNGVIIDVTEQKQADIALRQRTIELDALVRYTPGGVFSYYAEKNDRFTFVSDNMLKMLGYTHDEFIRKFNNSFAQMVYHEDRDRVLSAIDRQIEGSDFDECEYRIETKSGELMWVHDVGHLVVGDDGSRFFYVVIVDITARKKAEETSQGAQGQII